MAKNRKSGPLGFLKRNFLYIALIALNIVVVAVIVVTITGFVGRKPQKPREETTRPGSSESYVPSHVGTATKPLGEGALSVTYDANRMELTESEDLYSITEKGENAARLDIQRLKGSLHDLTQADKKSLAMGLLQAYYHVPPATQTITVTEEAELADSYVIALSAPASGETPAANAKIQLMQSRGRLWYAIMLVPEGADGTGMEQVFRDITIG